MKMADILSTVQLKGLKDHKYSSEGSTLLDPIMQKLWRWLVEQMPLWLAPNAITLVGLVCNVFTTHILLMYSPDARSGAPQWVYFLTGLGLFVYQCLDAIDGKQARRTNSATPLGELFDHGCDAVSIVYVIVGTCGCLQLAHSPHLYLFVNLFYMFLFYAAHWQTYCTGQLKFGKLDVTEGQFGIMAVYFLSAIFGADMWQAQFPVLGFELKLIPVALCVSSGCLTCYWYFSIIFIEGGVGKSGSTVAGTSVLGPIVPIGLHITFAVYIMSHSTVDLFENHPVLFVLTWGMIFSKITCKLIVAHMSRSEIELLDTSFLGPLMLFLTQYFTLPLPEYFLLWVAYIYATIDLLLYSSRVCKQICDYLNIYCFKITPQPDKKQTTTGVSTPSATHTRQNSNGTDYSRPVTRSASKQAASKK